MNRTILIGDTVLTDMGEGIVTYTCSWREALSGMEDDEAKEFSDRCRVEAGLNYRDVWLELVVVVGGVEIRRLGHQVTELKEQDDVG